MSGAIHLFFSHSSTALVGLGLLICWGFEITLRHTTRCRTPLDDWSARCRDLYMTTYNTHKRQTFMSPAGFEPAVQADERPKTHTLDPAKTGIGGAIHLILVHVFIAWTGKPLPCTTWIRAANETGVYETRTTDVFMYSAFVFELPASHCAACFNWMAERLNDFHESTITVHV
jgi:hypothetical protein